MLASFALQLVLAGAALDFRAADLGQTHRRAGLGHPVALDVVLAGRLARPGDAALGELVGGNLGPIEGVAFDIVLAGRLARPGDAALGELVGGNLRPIEGVAFHVAFIADAALLDPFAGVDAALERMALDVVFAADTALLDPLAGGDAALGAHRSFSLSPSRWPGGAAGRSGALGHTWT